MRGDAVTRDNCVCWDYETPDAECHCDASDPLPLNKFMGTDIGPTCECGETLWTYRVVAYRTTDITAKCASCGHGELFSSGLRLDNVADVRRRHHEVSDARRS